MLTRSRLTSAALLAAVPLAGCSMFHSNIKGGFACSAPTGTCAPSTTIDEAAIGEIDARSKPADANHTPADHAPADHQAAEGAKPAEPTSPHHRTKDKAIWIPGVPSRPVLRVVYLAWRDGTGRLHPRTTGYVAVDAPLVLPKEQASLTIDPNGAAPASNLLEVAERAPDPALIAPASSGAVAPSGKVDPIGAIKAQVKQILSTPKSGVTFPPAGN